MAKDKYTAVWVSHSSINDYLQCPRAYFLKNIYRDPRTRHKIKIMSPPLALGLTVHEVIESLSTVPTDKRFTQPLLLKFERVWQKVSGIKGGFKDNDQEFLYKKKGMEMLARISSHPGPLENLAVKINMDLPYYWLSEEDNIILCGKIDWLEYLKDSDSVHIIDFKTGQREEKKDSLQLPIYYLLVLNCQKRKVTKLSYWYLGKDDCLIEMPLPDPDTAYREIYKIAKDIKLARQLDRLKCKQQGCRYCSPLEAIIKGEARYVGVDDFKNDIYVIEKSLPISPDSTIL